MFGVLLAAALCSIPALAYVLVMAIDPIRPNEQTTVMNLARFSLLPAIAACVLLVVAVHVQDNHEKDLHKLQERAKVVACHKAGGHMHKGDCITGKVITIK